MTTGPPTAHYTVAVLGVGEVGTLFAEDLLRAGATVHGFDPALSADTLTRLVPGIIPAASEAEAVQDSDLVFSVNSAADSRAALINGLSGLPAGRAPLWVDFNSANPELKESLARAAAERGVPFLDAAIMSPIAGKGLAAPVLVSGPKSAEAAELLNRLGGRAHAVEGPVGTAAGQKLLRSIFFKGMAGVVMEALAVAENAGLEPWLHDHIAAEFAAFDRDTVTKLVEGTRRHALRRRNEMLAAVEFAEGIGGQPRITRAVAEALDVLSSGE